MPKKDSRFDIKIGAAVLRLAATRGWKKLTLEDVAKAAKIPAAQMKKQVATKNDLLPCVVRVITDETAASISKPDVHAAPHDRLFDVMMTRFDSLQKHRKAILSIMGEALRDSGMICKLLPAQGEAMRDMLILAKLDEQGPRRCLIVAGLKIVHLATLRIWKNDETLDMSKTMAALDRHLRMAGKAAEILFRV